MNAAASTARPPGAPPLRILLLDPHKGGGGQVRYVCSLAERFAAWGHHVVIGCRPESVLAERGRATGATVADAFAFASGLRLAKWQRDIARLRCLLREHQFDVVHVNGSQDHWVAAFERLLHPGSSVLLRTRHNTYKVPGHLANRWLNRRMTDWQICVCEMVRAELATLPLFDARRMTAIHNGVDPARYCPDPAAREDARREFGFTPGHFVFGIAARLNKAKGHEFLFRAAAALKDSHPHMRLLLLGEGEREAPLRALAEELGIAPMAVFAGFRDDVARCTQAFDAGVLPSIDCDTSSFSLKEEMAAEKPIIASDYGGLPEIVAHEREGLVVPAGEYQPLASAMRRMMDDAPLREALGKAGRARVLREFSLDAFAARTLEVYRQVIAMKKDSA